MSTTQVATPEVDTGKIDIVDGFNARQNFDRAELAQLAQTITTDGLVQPIVVVQAVAGSSPVSHPSQSHANGHLASGALV